MQKKKLVQPLEKAKLVSSEDADNSHLFTHSAARSHALCPSWSRQLLKCRITHGKRIESSVEQEQHGNRFTREEHLHRDNDACT